MLAVVLDADLPFRPAHIDAAPADHDLLARVRDLPVLTIGDEIDFCLIGGIINLQVIDGRVRFEISLTQARRANLKIDTQLLRLATHLHGGQP